jgi:hypothetical protein
VVDVILNNVTDVPISYEVLGSAEPPRSLSVGRQVVLRKVQVPVTISVIRQDKGLIGIEPIASRSGLLELNLNENPTIDRIYGVIRIDSDGQVTLD